MAQARSVAKYFTEPTTDAKHYERALERLRKDVRTTEIGDETEQWLPAATRDGVAAGLVAAIRIEMREFDGETFRELPHGVKFAELAAAIIILNICSHSDLTHLGDQLRHLVTVSDAAQQVELLKRIAESTRDSAGQLQRLSVSVLKLGAVVLTAGLGLDLVGAIDGFDDAVVQLGRWIAD